MPAPTQPGDVAPQQLIYAAKRQWEMTVDAIGDPLILIDHDYRILRANKAVAELSGAEITAIPGRRCHQALFNRDRVCEGCPVAAAVEADVPQRAEIRCTDGERTYEMGAYPMVDEQDTPRVVCIYNDVTRERRLTRGLIQAEKMAAVGQLAGGVAHELNNPLGGILAFTQLLKRETPADHPRASYLDEIEKSALRCKRIVDSLLNFARKPRDDERRLLDLNRPARDAVFLVHYRLRQQPAQVVEELAEGLPLVLANANQLQQVFVNLLNNALDAVAERGPEGRIVVHTEPGADGGVIARVTDNGTGIHERHLGKILEPFFTTKEEGKGTGLGLAICYRILEDHGAAIDVASRVGAGTTFTLTFPPAPAG